MYVLTGRPEACSGEVQEMLQVHRDAARHRQQYRGGGRDQVRGKLCVCEGERERVFV